MADTGLRRLRATSFRVSSGCTTVMADDAQFLSDLPPRRWSPPARYGLSSARLFLGRGALGLEVAVARSGRAPKRSDVLECWKTRKGGRAAPVLLVVLHPDGAALCGPSGQTPPVYPDVDPGQVERLCRETLAQPDRHAALRFLSQALPSLETALPGLNNEGLLALHELQHGVPERTDWTAARRKAARVLGARDRDLLSALGFRIERLDNLTSLLRRADRRTALAVLLRDTESPEAGTDRFNGLSPISYGLKKADDEDLPWVVLVQGDRLRLYATAVETGVGRRGRTETYVECQPALLSTTTWRISGCSSRPMPWLRMEVSERSSTSLGASRETSPTVCGSASTNKSFRPWRTGSPTRAELTAPVATVWSRRMRWPSSSCSDCSSSHMPKTATCSRTDTTTPIAAGP